MTSADHTDLSPDLIRDFVLASHGNLARVEALFAEHPTLLTAVYDWGPSGLEDGLGAAAHVGNRAIAEFFLGHGVPLNICTAAMLGRTEDVKAFLDADPSSANARGAHGISLMFHAAMSGDVSLAQMLVDRGCIEGFDHALHGAIMHGREAMVEWLLTHGVTDINTPDYQGKTPLTRAEEGGQPGIAALLKQHGA